MAEKNDVNSNFIKLVNELDLPTLCSIASTFCDKTEIQNFLANTLPDPYKLEVLDNFKNEWQRQD